MVNFNEELIGTLVHIRNQFLFFFISLSVNLCNAQPNWPEIKANASCTVPDDGCGAPYLLKFIKN